MANMCGDNRFEIIEKAKKDLLESTNIQTSADEMKVLDNFLFRCWQKGWLKKYDQPKTNADGIRNMDDMELAEFLGKINLNDCKIISCIRQEEKKGHVPCCKECFIEWLQAEVDGDTK